MKHAHTHNIVVIYGPTASGKTQFAIELAKKILSQKNDKKNGAATLPVIINTDALQQYHDLPLLSAQPNADDKKICPHVLYGFLSAQEESNVANWLRLALTEVQNCFTQNHLPILVGGSGLYIKTFLTGLSPMPNVPPEIKNNLVDGLAANPEKLQDYYQQLLAHDPEGAKKLAKNDKTRIIRALSILMATGQPLSTWQAVKPQGGFLDSFPHAKIDYYYLAPPREQLLNNIRQRTMQILAQGAIAEYQDFLNQSPAHHKDLPIKKTIGAQAIERYLAGDMTMEKLQEHIIVETRQYAKRQATWYRGQLQPLFEKHTPSQSSSQAI